MIDIKYKNNCIAIYIGVFILTRIIKMAEGINNFMQSIWFKLICLLVAGLFTIVSGYGAYHLNRLDSIVRDMQNDKIELIDRINSIDGKRQGDIDSVKDTVNQINTTLQMFIAKSDANKFTSKEGLEIWREISTIKANILSMQKEIDRNTKENK